MIQAPDWAPDVCLPQVIIAGAQSQSFQFQGLSFHGVNVCTRHCAIPFDR